MNASSMNKSLEYLRYATSAVGVLGVSLRPNTQDLVVLGAIVAIRTVISYSLNAELAHEIRHRQTEIIS